MKLTELRQIIREEISKTLNEGAEVYPFQASPEKISLYDRIANELKKTISMIANQLDISESNIRISLDGLWYMKNKNKDKGMIVQIKADDTQWEKAWTGNALIIQTQNGEGVTVSHYYGTKINGNKNPKVRDIYNKVLDSDLESLVASENTRITNSLSSEELESIAPNTPVIVTGK